MRENSHKEKELLVCAHSIMCLKGVPVYKANFQTLYIDIHFIIYRSI
jgi:hypothetical protein